MPRPLVEKYGRNSFSLSSAEMPQPVSATSSSTVLAGGRARGDQQPFDRRLAHGFGGVVDQVHHHALELIRVDIDRRQIGRQFRRAGRFRPAGPRKHRSAFRTISFRSHGTGCAAGKRENCENSSASFLTDSTSREMVAAHSRSDAMGVGRRDAAIELARDALGGERDRA